MRYLLSSSRKVYVILSKASDVREHQARVRSKYRRLFTMHVIPDSI